jgi:hypothetical protein
MLSNIPLPILLALMGGGGGRGRKRGFGNAKKASGGPKKPRAPRTPMPAIPCRDYPDLASNEMGPDDIEDICTGILKNSEEALKKTKFGAPFANCMSIALCSPARGCHTEGS